MANTQTLASTPAPKAGEHGAAIAAWAAERPALSGDFARDRDRFAEYWRRGRALHRRFGNRPGPGSPEAEAFIPAASAATALIAGLLTLAMGIVANTPIAMAAGLGINGAVAFGLVLTQGLTPAGAMGVIVLEGIVVKHG